MAKPHVDDEYDAFMARNADKKPDTKKLAHPIAHAIAGWWMVSAAFGLAVIVVSGSHELFAWWFVLFAGTMPAAVIAAVIASRPTAVRVGWGAHRLPRV